MKILRELEQLAEAAATAEVPKEIAKIFADSMKKHKEVVDRLEKMSIFKKCLHYVIADPSVKNVFLVIYLQKGDFKTWSF